MHSAITLSSGVTGRAKWAKAELANRKGGTIGKNIEREGGRRNRDERMIFILSVGGRRLGKERQRHCKRD